MDSASKPRSPTRNPNQVFAVSVYFVYPRPSLSGSSAVHRQLEFLFCGRDTVWESWEQGGGGGRWFPGACKLKAFFFFPLFSSFFFFFFFFKWCIEAKGYPPRQQTGLKQQSLSDKSDLKPVRGVGTGRAQHVSADRRLWMGMQAVNLFFLIWPFRDIQPSVYQTQLANKCPSQIKFTQFWPENSADDAVSPANGEMYVSQQPRDSNITINNIIIVKD